jgi:hypothetical protein
LAVNNTDYRLPKFLKTTRELLSPQSLERARDVLYLAGEAPGSKGGRAKANKAAPKLKERNQKILASFADQLKSGAKKRHVIVPKLAKAHKLSLYQIRKIIRQK